MEELLEVLSKALNESVAIDQVLGFVSKDEEGVMVVYNEKQYLLTVKERPEKDSGIAFYEIV